MVTCASDEPRWTFTSFAWLLGVILAFLLGSTGLGSYLVWLWDRLTGVA